MGISQSLAKSSLCSALLFLVPMFALVGAAADGPGLTKGSHLDLSGMHDVAGREFRTPVRHALLIFSSSRQNADQTRRWGKAISDRYGDNIARWDEEKGEPILIVPVLDLSGKPRMVPKGLVAKMVKLMGGDDEVLLDWNGELGKKIGAPIDEAAVLLVGPDSKVQAITIGDYSASAAPPLFAAMDAQISLLPRRPSKPSAPASKR